MPLSITSHFLVSIKGLRPDMDGFILSPGLGQKTGHLCSKAKSMVCIVPLLSANSIATVACDKPTIRRFLLTNLYFTGGVPTGYSDINVPPAVKISLASCLLAAG